MFIRTKRLFLRPPFPEDWRGILSGINDAGVVRMLARAPWPYTAADAQAFCNRLRDPFELEFAITLPGVHGAPLIGMIGLNAALDVPEVGYWIARGHRRQGFAAEALGGVLDIARMLGAARVAAGHFVDNPASGGVLRKAGFAETGEVRATNALGRGGQLVLERRFVRDMVDGDDDGGMPVADHAKRQAA